MLARVGKRDDCEQLMLLSRYWHDRERERERERTLSEAIMTVQFERKAGLAISVVG